MLEHPAGSRAWSEFELTRPWPHGWYRQLWEPGWVTEVDQGVYGHRARKRTWLYVVGAERLPELDWSEAASDVIVSGFLHHTGTDESRRVRPLEASRTPTAFRDALLKMARSASRVPA